MVEIGGYARSKVIGGARVANVTDHDLTFGLTHIHAAYRDDAEFEYEFFRDEAEARKWLET